LDLVLAAAAVVVAGAVAYRTFVQPAPPGPSRGEAEYITEWKDGLGASRVVAGGPGAKAVLVEFTDLECPACAAFHRTLELVRDEFPGDLEVRYVPFPLDRHRFAMPSARGAECAATEGKLAAWIDIVYEAQDSLGLIAWGELAARAGLSDTSAIAKCVLSRERSPAIESGLEYGARVGVSATPTILVNGWKLAGVPNRTILRAAITRALAGESLQNLATDLPVLVPAVE